jgi:hypothetical protein
MKLSSLFLVYGAVSINVIVRSTAGARHTQGEQDRKNCNTKTAQK